MRGSLAGGGPGFLLPAGGRGPTEQTERMTGMAKLLYQGHGSFRITLRDGRVLYVDPYMGEGYDLPADVVLITHEHHDHNKLELLTLRPDSVIHRPADMLAEGEYRTVPLGGGLTVTAVPAYNRNHSREECVGYLITVDGVTLYAAGDTSTTDAMPGFRELGLDYALLPGDGIYNMDIPEAVRCAELIGARHTIPIHLKPEAPYDPERAARFITPSALLVRPGEEIEL